MKINGTQIGSSHPPYTICEISANHNGSIETALKLITAAKVCGASTVKLQLYDPARLAIARGGLDKVLTSGPWAGRNLFDLYTKAHTPMAWFPVLFEHAERVGITIFSSVFDAEGVEFLDKLGVPAFKISSFDTGNLPLLRKAGATGKPVIISTGMAHDDTIGEAILEVSRGGSMDCALLHCVSAYPCPIEEANINRVSELRYKFLAPVGFSDHTLGNDAAIGAVALGACIIEKHLTLSRADGGLDAEFSAEPAEFKQLVSSVNNVWLACREPSGNAETYKDLRVQAA